MSTTEAVPEAAGVLVSPTSSHAKGAPVTEVKKHHGGSDSESGSADEAKPRLHAKTFLAVFAVCCIYFVEIFNVVGAGAQTNTIALTLGGSSSSVWLSSPIAILTAVLSPIISQAADCWGRKWFLVILTFIGAVGSIVVARATTMNMAIAGFTITGIAYGAQPLLHAVSSEVLPRQYRAYGQAADLIANGLGGIVALVVSGAFTRTSNVPSEGFRNFWYLAAGLFVLSSVLCAFVYSPPPTEKQSTLSFGEKMRSLDWIGYFLFAAGIVLFCIGLSWSANPYPWSDPHTSATFAVGLFLILLFALYETFVKKDGMFHHGLFQNRNFPLAVFCIFCEGIAFFAANNYFAFQVGVLYETDALIVGVRYSITMWVSIPACIACGVYCSVVKKVRWVTVVSFLFFVAFFACMATSTTSSSSAVWGYPALLGTGLGLSLCVLVTVAQLSTPPDLIAITSGLVIGLRSLGGSVGLAIYNALFNEAMDHVGDNIAGAVLPMGLPPTSIGPFIEALTANDEESLFKITGVTPQIVGAGADALLGTYNTGFKHVWIASSCFVAVAAVVACFLQERKKEFNMHIDAPVEKEEELYSH